MLDADGVPIKVGDTVYTLKGKELVVESIHANEYCAEGEEPEHLIWCGEYVKDTYPLHHIANQLTHRKPDTQEAINHDAMLMISESFFDKRRDEFEDRVFTLLERQRKLMGDE